MRLDDQRYLTAQVAATLLTEQRRKALGAATFEDMASEALTALQGSPGRPSRSQRVRSQISRLQTLLESLKKQPEKPKQNPAVFLARRFSKEGCNFLEVV